MLIYQQPEHQQDSHQRLESMISPSTPSKAFDILPKNPSVKRKVSTKRQEPIELSTLLLESRLHVEDAREGTRIVLTEEGDMLFWIAKAEKLTRKIINANKPWLPRENARDEGQCLQSNKHAALRRELLVLLKAGYSVWADYFPMHQINPYVGLFVKQAQQLGLDVIFPRSNAPCDPIYCSMLNQRMDAFISGLRSEAKSSKFKTLLNSFHRGPEKNKKSNLQYINTLFTQRSKLLILRIDLAYSQTVAHALDTTRTRLTYADVKQHRTRFLAGLRKLVEQRTGKKCFVGYIWKTEYGVRKSWHHHLLIFLDGQLCREDINHAMLIGEYWADLTEGLGVYHNCNIRKMRYKSCGIGLVAHNDTEKRHGLKLAIEYITKPDYYARLKLPDGERSCGRGIMPKPSVTGFGRPRKKPSNNR